MVRGCAAGVYHSRTVPADPRGGPCALCNLHDASPCGVQEPRISAARMPRRRTSELAARPLLPNRIMLEQFDWLASLRSSPVLLALLISAVLTAGYALERLVYFAVRGGSADHALALALDSLRAGREEEALRVLTRCSHPFGPVALEILRAPETSAEGLEERIRIALTGQRLLFERHLGLIGTMGKITPLMGLLGTVWGTMRALHEISRPGIQGSSLLASGVAEALLTSAVGLVVAVPALFVFHQFTRHVGNQLTVAEHHARTLRLEAEAARGSRPSERAA